MQSDSFIYKFYYQWWKNIDKSIFTLISLLFIIGLFFSLVSTSLIASDKLDTHSYFFFFNDTATTEIYTLSLHDALPILIYFLKFL